MNTKRITDKPGVCSLLAGGLLAVTLGVGSVLASISVHADVTDMITVNVLSSCSMARTGGDGTYSDTVNSGTYVIMDGSTFKVACNDGSGFAIYAIGYSGDAYTGASHTALIGNPSSLGNIITGTATSGDTSNWAMMLTANSGSYNDVGTTIESDYQSYAVVPDTYTRVAYRAAATDVGANAVGSSVTTHYRVFASAVQGAGTYTGQVKYTLVHPVGNDPDSYYVNFYANGGSGAMAGQKIAASTATALTANSFTAPTGKIFDSWNTEADGSGTSYANTALVTGIADAGGTIALYAQWAGNEDFDTAFANANKVKYRDYYKLQDASGPICSNVSVGSVTTLIDARDRNTYIVGKLEDGNCWFLENLALDISSVDLEMLNGNTNATEEALSCLKTGEYNNVACDSPYSSSGVVAKTLDGGSWSNSYNVPYVATGYVDTVVTHSGNGDGEVGTYYNYCAASAGSYCYSSGAGVNADGLQDVAYDICPSGWHLPTSAADSGEYYDLYTDYASNAGSFVSALSLPLSGIFDDGSASGHESQGYFWSSTFGDASNMYRLYIESDNVSFSKKSARSLGLSVRCVLNNS